MKKYNEKLQKEVLWDMSIADTASNVYLRMHEPVRKGNILSGDEPWEGEHCCYGKIIFDGEKYRLYYRGSGRKDGIIYFFCQLLFRRLIFPKPAFFYKHAQPYANRCTDAV